MEGKELFQEGQRLFMEGKVKESIDAFTNALKAGYEPRIIYLSRGVAYIQMRDLNKAIEDFSKAIEIDIKSDRAYYYRGIAFMNRRDYENAVSDLSRSIELKPDHGAAYFVRGTIYAQMEKDDEAVKDLKTALLHSETAIHGVTDTIGIDRTLFDKALPVITGERRPTTIELSEEEMEMLKKWIE